MVGGMFPPQGYGVETEQLSYIVFIDDDGYAKAKNCKTGKIDFASTDATTVIQSALNALTPNRTWKEKVVIKGNFENVGRINIPSYTILEIQGSLKAKNALNNHLLYTYGTTNIEIHGGIIDGNRLNQTAGYNAINIANCTRAAVNRVHVKSWLGNTVHVHNSSHVWVTYCSNEDIDTSGVWSGIVFSGTSTACFAIGNSMYGSIQAVGTSNIIGNKVYGYSGAHGGIYAYGTGTLVANNYATGFAPGHGGIEVRGYGNVIIGNVLENNSGNGIELNAYNSTEDVRRNVVVGNVIRANSSHGIYITRTNGNISDLLIADNVVIDNGGYGIYMESISIDNVRITSNILLGNTSGAIRLSPYATNVFIRGNVGYLTENSGTATIPANQTSVTVNHGLATTPGKVLVTPRGNVGTVWVSARDATSFTVNCSTAPSADTIIDWYAEV